MHLLKLFKMKIKFINLMMLILFGFSATAQIDNGTNYIQDSRNGDLNFNSQCDQLFIRNGEVISVIVKETTSDFIKYKTCNNYGSLATIKSGVVLISSSKVDKIIYSNTKVQYFNGRTYNNLSITSLFKKEDEKKEFSIDKRNYIFVSGGTNQFSQAFAEIGILKQKSKNFAYGTSFSFMRRPYEYSSYYDYVYTYDFVGIDSGPYTSNGTYIGTAGWDLVFVPGSGNIPIYSGNGPYNSSGNYVGTNGGYEQNYSYQAVIDETPEINHFSFFADLKFSFLAKKRIQPFVISSFGGTLTSVGYTSTPNNNYTDVFTFDVRLSSGIDFFFRNNKMVLSLISNATTNSVLDAIFGMKFSISI
tara:strand:+ start:705 stop:1784 length:1080 start_codon:yes stop_codon:yes gene_type:complete